MEILNAGVLSASGHWALGMGKAVLTDSFAAFVSDNADKLKCQTPCDILAQHELSLYPLFSAEPGE